MARKHALLISLAVALALVAGVFAAVRTTELGASASTGTTLSDAELTSRDSELDRIARRIRDHAGRRPPKLPALLAPMSSGGSGSQDGSISSGPGPGTQLVSSSGPGSASGGHDDFDDHDADDFDFDDHDDDASGHGRGHGGDDEDGSSGHGHGGEDDGRRHD